MKLRDFILFAIIVIGIIMYFQWRISRLEDKIITKTEFTNEFKQLSDGLSAKAETKVVLPPNEWQKFFNTGANKEFKKFMEDNLGTMLTKEVAKIKIQPGGTTVINKSSILIQGDSAVFRNDDGLVTKTVKVMPINKDSSMMILVPQEIDVTSVDVRPDPNKKDSLLFFMTAVNRTTGDTLKVNNSISYVIPREYKKWKIDLYPSIGSAYNVIDGEWIMKAGVTPILFRGKRFDADLLGIEFSYGFKNHSAIEVQLINIQLKKRRY